MNKTAFAALLACGSLSFGAFAQSPNQKTAVDAGHQAKVKSVIVSFATTGDDKDGDTQVINTISINDKIYWRLECCSAGKNSADKWKSGTTNERAMTPVAPMTRAELAAATIEFGMRPNGGDTWEFKPTLKVTYDVGQPEEFAYEQFHLRSDNSYTNRKFGIPVKK